MTETLDAATLARYQDPLTIQQVLHRASTIAIVGLSANELRASHFVGYYLKRHGYQVIPVNPRESEILGETSYPSLRTDIRNAGGTWVDQMVHVDQHLVTSRNVPDLPAFSEKSIQVFARAMQQATLDEIGEESFPASDPPSTSPSVGRAAPPSAP